MEYFYLLKVRTSSENNLYKIGRTAQKPFKRINQYQKDTDVIIILTVINSIKFEKDIICQFKKIFIHENEIGNEYFRGDEKYMVNSIICIYQTNIYTPFNKKEILKELVISFLKDSDLEIGEKLFIKYDIFVENFYKFLLCNNYNTEYNLKKLLLVLSDEGIILFDGKIKDTETNLKYNSKWLRNVGKSGTYERYIL